MRFLSSTHPRADVARKVDAWVRDYISAPHRDLGRSGAVCPYVEAALKHDAIQYVVVVGARSTQEVVSAIERLRVRYETQRDDDESSLKTMIAVFPDVREQDAAGTILPAQRQMKTAFVSAGLMLGEFWSGNRSPGIHNPSFCPLDSPVPLLVIRPMVRSDLIFLREDERWMRSWQQRFVDAGARLEHGGRCRDGEHALSPRSPPTGTCLDDSTSRVSVSGMQRRARKQRSRRDKLPRNQKYEGELC
jgi:hypothetical protein